MLVTKLCLSYKPVFFNSGSAEPFRKFRKTLVGFRGLRVPWGFLVLFRENDFLLQCIDVSLRKILDHRAAFRLQVGQLVIQEVENNLEKKKKKYW